MKRIIISAADENFRDLLLDLLNSLHQWNDPLADAIGILDLGLSDDTLSQIAPMVTYVVKPDWDILIDPALMESQSYKRAGTARPFLRKYFPGYDYYLWLDGDTWVQERFVIDQFFRAAATGAIGIVPQEDPCYTQHQTSIAWRLNRLRDYFGEEGKELHASNPYFNAGAFSLHCDAAHWDLWAKHFGDGLRRSPALCTDQTALNFTIWKEELPFQPLPALCNWTCHLAMPGIKLANGKLCEPRQPHREIGLVHLTAHTKSLQVKLNHPHYPDPVSYRFNGRKARF